MVERGSIIEPAGEPEVRGVEANGQASQDVFEPAPAESRPGPKQSTLTPNIPDLAQPEQTAPVTQPIAEIKVTDPIKNLPELILLQDRIGILPKEPPGES